MPTARRFALASASGGGVATAVFCWMITFARWDLLAPQPFGEIFDAQARSLFDGRWDVPLDAVGFEGFLVDDRIYTYFGPFPALLRMPVLLITDRFDGRLTILSMVVALWVLLAATSLLHWRVRNATRGAVPLGTGELVSVGAFTALVGCGSIVAFLGSRGLVYHEVELWGVAWAVSTIAALFGFATRPSLNGGALLAVCTTATMMTRVSVGVGVVSAVALVAAAQAWCRLAPRAPGLVRRWAPGPDARGRWHLVVLVAAVIVPIALYAWVNVARFGSPTALPLDKQLFTELDEARRQTLAANGGSLFGIKFVPTAALQYARPDAISFDDDFPWVAFPDRRAHVVGNVLYDTRDRSSSVPASMPGFTLLAIVGAVKIVRTPRLRVLEPVVIGGVAGTFFILTIAFIAHRYLADFLPPLLAASAVGFQSLFATNSRVNARTRRAAIGCVAVVLLAGAWASFGLARVYQGSELPDDGYRRGEVERPTDGTTRPDALRITGANRGRARQ